MPRKVLGTLVLTAALATLAPATASADYAVSGPASINEAAGTASYTVTRAVFDSADPSVAVSGGTATPGADVGTPSAVHFGAGLSTGFTVPIVNDALDENNETYTVTVSGGIGQPGSATTTINDDDVTVDAGPVTLNEGAPATVTLTPRAAPAHEMRIDFASIPGTTTLADFTAAQGTVTWAAGDASPKTITVQTTADRIDEDDETLGVLLGSTTDTVAVPAVAVTILDDDPPPLIGAVATKATEGASGTKALQVLVGLSAPSGRAIRVPYTTRNGTARAPGDYTATSGTLTFNPGEVAKAVGVRIVGDRTAEQDETFTLNLGPPENATINAGGATATITIADDDGGGDNTTAPRLKIRSLKRTASGVAATLGCPRTEISCRGALTLFTVADRRSSVKALRTERRLGRATYRLSGNKTRRVTVRISRATRSLMRRGRSVRVRAFAVTTDAGGNVADTSRSATLRFG
jgi:hypothetical protein